MTWFFDAKVNREVNQISQMKATISIVCYKHKVLANGESPLMLRVHKNGKRTMKSLGVSVNPAYWDFKKEEPKPKCPNRDYINQIVLKTRLEYERKLLQKQVNEEVFTAESFVKEETADTAIKAQTVEDFFASVISTLRASGNIGNSYAYLNTYNSLKAFNKGNKLAFTFSHITVNFLKRYEDWLRGNDTKETTISYYFRTLRATYNKAIEAKIVSRDKSPFSEYKVGKFNTKTQKRALSKEEVMAIINADTSNKPYIRQLTQDIFTFSYLCGGISFVDIANLTADNIQGNRLIYKRQKTHGNINLPLSENALQIIEKNKCDREEADYLFPILHAKRHITPMQKSNRVHKICHQVNQELRKFAKDLKIESEVTTYVARHTFATVLKRSGVNIAIISESLGHSDLATTQIYLDSFENSAIDEAMKNLL